MFPAKNYKLVKKVKHGLDRDESPRRNFHPGTISLFLSPYNGPRTIITSFEVKRYHHVYQGRCVGCHVKSD